MTAMQKIAEARNAEALLALLRDTMARLDQYHAALHKVLDPMLTRSAEVAASTQEDWRPLKTCDAGGYSRETLRAWCTKVCSERKRSVGDGASIRSTWPRTSASYEDRGRASEQEVKHRRP